MGNKHEKKKRSSTQPAPVKKNNLEEEEEFFDDNMPKFRVKKNQVGLEHNLLVSQYKTNPFSDYKKIKELGSGSFATVYLVKHNTTGSVRAMKEIKKISNEGEVEYYEEEEYLNKNNKGFIKQNKKREYEKNKYLNQKPNMINKKEEINKSQQVKEKNRSSNKQPIKQIQKIDIKDINSNIFKINNKKKTPDKKDSKMKQEIWDKKEINLKNKLIILILRLKINNKIN